MFIVCYDFEVNNVIILSVIMLYKNEFYNYRLMCVEVVVFVKGDEVYLICL